MWNKLINGHQSRAVRKIFRWGGRKKKWTLPPEANFLHVYVLRDKQEKDIELRKKKVLVSPTFFNSVRLSMIISSCVAPCSTASLSASLCHKHYFVFISQLRYRL